MHKLFFGVSLLVLMACQTSGTRTKAAFDDTRLDALTFEKLETFSSDNEFRTYLREVKKLAEKRDMWWAEKAGVTYLAQNEDCVDEDDCASDEVVVTGSRVVSKPSPNITNVQMAGVDEGDIVKQIGDHLVLLQDGRLFSVDMGGGPGTLEFVDRKNVYDDSDSDTWYDEILVFDRKILVTGYSYDEEGTEMAIFELDENGQFEFVSRFFRTSDDYYDPDNYASRIAGDKLVVHTPMILAEYDGWAEISWPSIRRWVDEDVWVNRIESAEDASNDGLVLQLESRLEKILEGEALVSAREIHRPVQRTAEPVIHTISVCDLNEPPGDDPLSCETTSFIAPWEYEFYVTDHHAYVWSGVSSDEYREDYYDEDCDADYSYSKEQTIPSAIYRVPLEGGQLKVVGVRGGPKDQFSYEANAESFQAIHANFSHECETQRARPNFISFDQSKFSRYLKPLRANAYTLLPFVGEIDFENRFTDSHVVLASDGNLRAYPPMDEDDLEDYVQTGEALVVPRNNPTAYQSIALPHDTIRLERVGNDVLTTGYNDLNGLKMSYVSLSGAPRVSDTVNLKNRFESEGRSHAFNYGFLDGDSTIIGIPTVSDEDGSGRWWWRSEQSDVSFLKVDAAGKFTSLGPLTHEEDSVHEDYECDVSCIDWYGNSRPIFTNGRVFALSGTEIIEGYLSGGRIFERQRLNLTEPRISDEPSGETFSP